MKKNIIKYILAVVPLLLPFIVYADFPNPIQLVMGGSPIDTVPKFLLALVDGFIAVMTPIIVIFIIYAGFLFVTAQGNESKLSSAKTIITWSLVGAGVLLGAKVISAFVEATVLSIQ